MTVYLEEALWSQNGIKNPSQALRVLPIKKIGYNIKLTIKSLNDLRAT